VAGGSPCQAVYDPKVVAGSSMGAVLFTDLVGSTELMARLGDTAFDRFRSEHFAILREAVAACGGVEVKTTGDGILASFTSAVDALAAAVTAQQATDRQRRAVELPVEIRVGLAIGEVAFDDAGDVFGTPVVEAARLLSAAGAGQILCSALVRAMAGSRAGVAFTDLGALELKGLPDPVPACEVAWEPVTEAAAAAMPLPSVVTGVGHIFVGRDEELARLRQWWKEARAGTRRLVLVGGEPGVGKTRLAAALAHELHADGALVLAGRCGEDLGVPYQPFVEALRHHVTHASAPRLGRHAGELPRLVPELAQLVPGLPDPLRSDPETERYRLFDAVAAWLHDVSGEAPVLLVVDDLHWAAKPTLLLLRHVLRSPDPLHVLIVATYRDTDVGRGHPLSELLADVPRLDEAERLFLSGLDVPGVVAFMEKAAGHNLDDNGVALAQTIWRETEGNAFFVAEVLRHLAESGAIAQQDGRWVVTGDIADVGIPAGVRDVVGRRLSRLSPEANRVLAIASVVGLEFEPSVVQLAGGLDEEAVFASLEDAVAARLLVEVPGLTPRNRFSHALVRTTLYEELSAPRRVALHRRVAESLEALHAGNLDDDLPALAHHWSRAAAPGAETARAVDYAARAGDQALAQFAHDEAVGYYRQAIELLGVAGGRDPARHLELLLALGEAQQRAGDPAHRETLLQAAERAREQGDVQALTRAALANTRGLLPTAIGRVDDQKVAVLQAGIAAVGDGDPRARARLLATLAVELTFTGDWRRCLALSDDALTLARALGDPETLDWVLLTRYLPASVPDLLEERLINTAELVASVEHIADPALTAEAHLLRGRAAVEAGDIEEADRSYAIADQLSAGLGQPALRWRVEYILAARAMLAGRLPEAERFLVKSRDLGHAAGQAEADWVLACQLLTLRLEQGRVDDATVALLEEGQQTVDVGWNQSAVTVAACELGRDDQARAALGGLAARPVPLDVYWLGAMTGWAGVAAHLGDARSAQAIEVALRPYAGQAVPFVPCPTPSVAHHLGLLATTLDCYEEADRYFHDALAIHERIGAPHFVARTRLERASMLLRRRGPGDAEQAQNLLGQALSTARELGLLNVERRALALLVQPA